jgi:hypothetical protein
MEESGIADGKPAGSLRERGDFLTVATVIQGSGVAQGLVGVLQSIVLGVVTIGLTVPLVGGVRVLLVSSVLVPGVIRTHGEEAPDEEAGCTDEV